MSGREVNIYIDHELQWLLWQVVKAHNSKLGQMEPSITVDSLASDILMGWVKTFKPDLIKLYQRRKAIDDEAAELLKK